MHIEAPVPEAPELLYLAFTFMHPLLQIIALGASYFFAVTALDITTNVGTIDDLTSTARIVLVLPVAILDAVFILWVFTSLSKTLAQLQARRAGAKLDLYRSALCPRLHSLLWLAYGEFSVGTVCAIRCAYLLY